jgi:hypothetical protein
MGKGGRPERERRHARNVKEGLNLTFGEGIFRPLLKKVNNTKKLRE